jgi:hypothetical protein
MQLFWEQNHVSIWQKLNDPQGLIKFIAAG